MQDTFTHAVVLQAKIMSGIVAANNNLSHPDCMPLLYWMLKQGVDLNDAIRTLNNEQYLVAREILPYKIQQPIIMARLLSLRDSIHVKILHLYGSALRKMDRIPKDSAHEIAEFLAAAPERQAVLNAYNPHP